MGGSRENMRGFGQTSTPSPMRGLVGDTMQGSGQVGGRDTMGLLRSLSGGPGTATGLRMGAYGGRPPMAPAPNPPNLGAMPPRAPAPNPPNIAGPAMRGGYSTTRRSGGPQRNWPPAQVSPAKVFPSSGY